MELDRLTSDINSIVSVFQPWICLLANECFSETATRFALRNLKSSYEQKFPGRVDDICVDYLICDVCRNWHFSYKTIAKWSLIMTVYWCRRIKRIRN